MSFPHDDKIWADTAEFLRGRLSGAERLVAPDPFRWVIPRAQRFDRARGAEPRAFDWVVVHKGELDRIPRPFLLGLPAATVPVFANEVFVVFAAHPPADLIDLTESDHVRAFQVALGQLPPEVAAAPVPGAVTSVRLPGAAGAGPPGGQGVRLPVATPGIGLRAAPALPQPLREAAEAPARPWLAPGGLPGAARERAFQEELDRLILDCLASTGAGSVLDIGCGAGRLGALLPEAEVTGIDLDPAALARARARHAALPGHAFARMDALRLGFADATFDTVLLVDLLQDLADVPAALAEAARVLARGGRLLLTAPNRESLPLRALRRLALPVPGRGFSVQEVTGMLRAAGLTVARMDGIFLSPGWALPGAGGAMGPLEEDPEFIEAMRVLGRRCGPDHALAFGMVARKA